MTPFQRAVLFWVFIVVFVAAAVVSLGVFSGAWPWETSAFIERTAIGTLLASVVGAVVAAFKGLFTPRVDIFIAVDFPVSVDLLSEGRLDVWNEETGRVGQSQLILIEGTTDGGWYCRLPSTTGLSDRIRLRFWEASGVEWQVRYFSPRFSRHLATPRNARDSHSEGGV